MADFEKVPTMELGPRTTIERGAIVRVKGNPGRWKFLAHVTSSDQRRAPWVDVVQVKGPKNETIGGVRSFDARKITKSK